jgi:cytochrome c biogenesis protein CcmG/thiol:disulfide interchange protein DsbE
MAKFLVPLGLFVLLGVFLAIGLQRDPRYVPSPLIGKPAPEFSLPSLQDASYPVSSKELLGQPWVLNVWGTWCGGCRQEHDTLLTIARQKTVPIVGLNWKDAIDWGVYGAPETFLMGPDGTVLYKHIAPMTMEVWNTEFLPRIESARASGSRT